MSTTSVPIVYHPVSPLSDIDLRSVGEDEFSSDEKIHRSMSIEFTPRIFGKVDFFRDQMDLTIMSYPIESVSTFGVVPIESTFSINIKVYKDLPQDFETIERLENLMLLISRKSITYKFYIKSKLVITLEFQYRINNTMKKHPLIY